MQQAAPWHKILINCGTKKYAGYTDSLVLSLFLIFVGMGNWYEEPEWIIPQIDTIRYTD